MDIADKIKFLRTNILDLSQEKFAKKTKASGCCFECNAVCRTVAGKFVTGTGGIG